MNKKLVINDLLILVIGFLYIIPVLISENMIFNLIILLFAFLNLLILMVTAKRKINFKFLLFFLIALIPGEVSVFITSLIYTKDADTSPVINHFLFLTIYQKSLDNALFLTMRTFSLTLISFIYILFIQYDKLVISLMQNCKMNVTIGYSLLSVFNAFKYMKKEFIKIETSYKMRFLKNKFPLFLFFPLLVSASRYAYCISLSMESRGLNKNKTFVEKYLWSKIDTVFLIINLFQIIMLVIIFLVNKWFSLRIF